MAKSNGNLRHLYPQHSRCNVQCTRGIKKAELSRTKPLIDEYELEEFDRRIFYAMEHSLSVKVTVWIDGFPKEVIGRIHNVDPITHQLQIKGKPEKFKRIAIEDIVGVAVMD